MKTVVLSHPWRYYNVGDVLDLELAQAGTLIRAGYARPLEEVLVNLGGGWYEVPTRDGPTKIKGADKARRRLELEARRR